jgi:hypothetical protein
VFLLSKTLCVDINSLMQKFLWGYKENKTKISWMSLEKMGTSKARGGMGFRDLSCFNKALIAKQGRHLWHLPESLTTKIMRAKYYNGGSFLEAQLGKNHHMPGKASMGLVIC